MLAALLMDLIAEWYKTSGHPETSFSANCPHDFVRGIFASFASVDVVRNNGETLWSYDMHSNQATVHPAFTDSLSPTQTNFYRERNPYSK